MTTASTTVFPAVSRPRTAARRTLRALLSFFALVLTITSFAAYGQEKGEAELRKGLDAFDRKDYKTAVKLFSESAEKGNSDAMMMALCLETGKGTEKDDAESEKWRKKALDAGNLVAMMGTGQEMMNSADTKEEGLLLMKKAADRGSAFGQVAFALHCKDNGDGAKATEYLKKAAVQPVPKEKGILDYALKDAENLLPKIEIGLDDLTFEGSVIVAAQIILGGTYLRGDGVVEQDLAEAKKWFRKAGENGFAMGFEVVKEIEEMEKAGKELGSIPKNADPDAGAAELEKGCAAFEKEDWKAAAENFRAAAEKGNSDAMILLSFLLSHGNGVEKNVAMSTQWLKKAAEAGNPIALSLQGAAMVKLKSEKEGLALLRKSADRDCLAGCLTLGSILIQEGKLAESIEYLRKAASMPLSEEKSIYDFIGLTFLPDDMVKNMKQTNNRNKMIVMAQFFVGGAYLRDGKQTEAKKWFRMASDNGLATATQILNQLEEMQKKNKTNKR